MVDIVEPPKVVHISMNDSFEESAYTILKAIFPVDRVSKERHSKSFADIITGMVEEISVPVQQKLSVGGIDSVGIDKVRKTLLLVFWNQVVTDFGGLITVNFVEEE